MTYWTIAKPDGSPWEAEVVDESNVQKTYPVLLWETQREANNYMKTLRDAHLCKKGERRVVKVRVEELP